MLNIHSLIIITCFNKGRINVIKRNKIPLASLLVHVRCDNNLKELDFYQQKHYLFCY
jgi:hypothetical protein